MGTPPSTVPVSSPPPPLPPMVGSSRTYSRSPSPPTSRVRITTASRAGSVTYVVISQYRPALLDVVTVQAMPVPSVATVYVVSRPCSSVNVRPSVTTNRIDSTLVVSMVGSYTSDSTPPATVNHTFDVVSRAVPTQSLRARSKRETAPGPAGAGARAALAAAPAASPVTSPVTSPATRTTATTAGRCEREPARSRD